MAYWEFAIVVGTILVFSFIWTIHTYAVNLFADKFKTITPENLPENMTSKVKQSFDAGFETIYFFLLFSTLVLFAWVIKRTQKETKVV